MVRPSKRKDSYADTSGSPSSSGSEGEVSTDRSPSTAVSESKNKRKRKTTPIRKEPKKAKTVSPPKPKPVNRKSTGKGRKKSGSPSEAETRTRSRSSTTAGGRANVTSASKKPRYKPSSRALLEVKHYRSTTDLLILRRPFARLVKEITQAISKTDIRYKPSALEALQVAAEFYLVGLFEDAQLLTLHRRRVTLTDRDIILAKRIRGDDDKDLL